MSMLGGPAIPRSQNAATETNATLQDMIERIARYTNDFRMFADDMTGPEPATPHSPLTAGGALSASTSNLISDLSTAISRLGNELKRLGI